MIGIPELIVVSFGASAIFWGVQKFGKTGRLNSLLMRSYKDWESGNTEAAIGGYTKLSRNAEGLRDAKTRQVYEFASDQALGMLHRSAERYDQAEPHLRHALQLVDEGASQPAESIFLTRVELSFCHAAQNRDAECDKSIDRLSRDLDAMSPEDRLRVYAMAIPNLVAVGGLPNLANNATRILQLFADQTKEALHHLDSMVAEPTSQTAHHRSRNRGALHQAFQAPADVDDECHATLEKTFWVDAKIGQASIAAYDLDHEAVKMYLDQVQSSSVWWTLDQNKMRNGDELRANHELLCGSVAKAVELSQAVYEARVSDREPAYSIASSELSYGVILQGHGDYKRMLERLQSAHERIMKTASHPAHVSAWYPNMYALARLENGQYLEAKPLMDFAATLHESDNAPLCRAFTPYICSIYLRELDRLEESLQAVEESIRILDDAYGLASPQSVDHRLMLVTVLMLTERFDEAKRQLDLSNQSMKPSMIRNAYSTSMHTLVNASFNLHLGRVAEVESELKAFHSKLKPLLLPSHSLFASIQHMLGHAARLRGDPPKAIAHFQSAAEIRSATQTTCAPENLRLVRHLLEIHDQCGQTAEVEKCNRQLESIRAYQASCP